MKIYADHIVELSNGRGRNYNRCYIINIFPSPKGGFNILYVDPYDHKIHLEHDLDSFNITDRGYN